MGTDYALLDVAKDLLSVLKLRNLYDIVLLVGMSIKAFTGLMLHLALK